ncbi:MAG: thioesterase family protein [Pseudomonadota bacterium]|nr:thioesterase family protein [Pseudomonadota bacterium]
MSKLEKSYTGYGLPLEELLREGSDCEGLFIYKGDVLPEWIDMNGHMNVAYYVRAFDLAIDKHWAEIGVTQEYIENQECSTFSVECHITYQNEMKVEERYSIVSRILAYDEKRIHLFQDMFKEGSKDLVATAEWMNLHVNLKTRKVSPWPSDILTSLQDRVKLQERMSWPHEAGKKMLIKQPIYQINVD